MLIVSTQPSQTVVGLLYSKHTCCAVIHVSRKAYSNCDITEQNNLYKYKEAHLLGLLNKNPFKVIHALKLTTNAPKLLNSCTRI